jgi:hypothetical protein
MSDDTGAPADGAQTNGGDAGVTPKPAAPEPEKVLTQADVDRIVAERVARERKRFADYDEVKAAAKRLEEIEAANATDLEKAVKAAREEGRSEVITAANTRLRTAEARALAAEAKFRNPGLAVRAIDLDSVKVADDGTVDADAIKGLLKSLADAEPYLVDNGPVIPLRPKPDEAQGRASAPAGVSIADASGRDLLRDAYTKK